MTTKLEKPVSRELEQWGGTTSRDARKPMVVTLNPGGFITFRLKATRTEYDLDVASAYSLAVKRHAGKVAQAERKEKELKRQGLS